MLTDRVEDASIAMYVNVQALASCLDKRNAVSQFPAARKGFQHNPCPAACSTYFVDVELIQIDILHYDF